MLYLHHGLPPFMIGMRKWPVATPTGPGQSWDHEYLTKDQFTQLLKLFLSDNDTM